MQTAYAIVCAGSRRLGQIGGQDKAVSLNNEIAPGGSTMLSFHFARRVVMYVLTLRLMRYGYPEIELR